MWERVILAGYSNIISFMTSHYRAWSESRCIKFLEALSGPLVLKDEVSKIISAIHIESGSKHVAATEVRIRQGELRIVEQTCQKLKVPSCTK